MPFFIYSSNNIFGNMIEEKIYLIYLNIQNFRYILKSRNINFYLKKDEFSLVKVFKKKYLLRKLLLVKYRPELKQIVLKTCPRRKSV